MHGYLRTPAADVGYGANGASGGAGSGEHAPARLRARECGFAPASVDIRDARRISRAIGNHA